MWSRCESTHLHTLNLGSDLGAQVDGYISVVAATIIATNNPSTPTTGRKADVICAAHYAAEVALRLMKPGKKVGPSGFIVDHYRTPMSQLLSLKWLHNSSVNPWKVFSRIR